MHLCTDIHPLHYIINWSISLFCARSTERPTFLRRPINQVVLEEETVEFRCQVQGDPQPNVRWRKDDIDVPRGRYVHLQEHSQKGLNFKKGHFLQTVIRWWFALPLFKYMSIQFWVCVHICVCLHWYVTGCTKCKGVAEALMSDWVTVSN